MGNHNIKSIIKEGTVENVKEYLSHEPDMKNHVFRYGWTPTHLAVEYHKLDILKYLIEEAKADVRHVDNAQSNLLHHALHFADEHFDIVKYLLESGQFKFDATKDEHDNTTLHLAFKYCSMKQIAELKKYYKGLKDIFQEKNDHGMTPLALLKERCKNQPESLVIIEQLQEEIERGGSDEEKKSGDEGKSGGGGSSSGIRGSKSGIKLSHSKGGKPGSSDEGKGSKVQKKDNSGEHEEKEENKKHSDDDKDGGSSKKGKKKTKKDNKDGSSNEHKTSSEEDRGSSSDNGSGKKKGSKKKKEEDVSN